MPFKPGESGNPGGRPKETPEFRLKARVAVDKYVIDKWIDEVATGGDDWIKASELLAAYGYGKPSQSFEVNDITDRSKPEMTPEEAIEMAQWRADRKRLQETTPTT